MRRIVVLVALCCVCPVPIAAQISVFDPAVTARNTATAIVQELLLNTERIQHDQLRRMAQRLLTSLSDYAVPEPPRWRTHGGDFLFTGAHNDALAFGDPTGAALLALSHPLADALDLLARLPPDARRALASRLATVHATDAASTAATHTTGAIRFNSRHYERMAMEQLEAHVIDLSAEQSATAVLDKISGAVLIGARQRHARAQLLVALVEQLLMDTKRARDTDAAVMNMQLTSWRDRRAANEAFAAGTGDALNSWRQP